MVMIALALSSLTLADEISVDAWEHQPVLVAGERFDGETAVESFAEVDAKGVARPQAIARWNVVPHQQIKDRFAIGVLAFHISGIDRVEFSLSGGPWLAINQCSNNPRTGTKEFWTFIDSRNLDEGNIEVRAVAYPVDGLPRILQGPANPVPDNGEQSLWLMVSHDEAPRQTLTVGPGMTIADAVGQAAAGAVIQVPAGIHDLGDLSAPSAEDGWITIQPAPGVERDDVIIRPDERRDVRARVPMLRFHNVSLDLSKVQRIYAGRGARVWFDGSRLFDTNGWAKTYDRYFNILHPQTTGYMTDCVIEDTIYGAPGMDIVRNCTLRRISGDAFQNSKLVVDSTLEDMDDRVLKHHSDIFQYWAPKETRLLENRIAFNVTARNVLAQHIFMRTSDGATFRDFAFVDIDVHQIPGVRGHMASQLYGNHEHVLFIDVRSSLLLLLRRPGDARPGEGYMPSHVLFDNCAFTGPTVKSLLYGGHGITTRDLRVHDEY